MKISKMALLRFCLLVTAVLIMSLFAGCVKNVVSYGNGKELAVGKSATVADLTAGSAMEEANRVQAFKSKEKANYDRHYANGLYFKDYTATKERLNQEFSRWMEAQMAVELKKVKDRWVKNGATNLKDDTELLVKGKIECYNDILENVQANNMPIEEVLKDAKNIRSITAEIYSFENMKTKGDDKYFTAPSLEALVNVRNPIITRGIPFEARISSHEKEILKKFSLNDLQGMENLRGVLDDFSANSIASFYEGTESRDGILLSDSVIYELESLKARYGEDFVYLYSKADYSTFYAPKRDTSIRFEADRFSSRYLAVTAQKLMSDAVNKVLEENGASDHVVQFTAPVTSASVKEELTMSYDVKGIQDPLHFLKEDFPQGFQTSLYYLYEEGENIDFEELKRISLAVNSLLNETSCMLVYFYKVDEMGQKVLVDLFKQHTASEYFTRPRLGGLNLTEMYRTRTESEGFRYLDVYGTRDEYMLYYGSPPLETALSGEELFEKYKRKDIWGN